MVREVLSAHIYLSILMKLWPSYWESQLKRINIKVGVENGRSMGRIRILKVQQFSSNEYCKNIGYIISAPTFGIRGSVLCKKEEGLNISLIEVLLPIGGGLFVSFLCLFYLFMLFFIIL